jgi:hypothetical protein
MRNLCAILTSAFLAVCLASTPAQAKKKIDCRKDLKEAVELLNEMWSFKFYKPGIVDLDATYKELEPRAKQAKTPEACAEVLELLMARLDDGHSRLQSFPELGYSTPYLALRSQRERLTQVPGQRPKVHVYVTAQDTTDEVLRAIPRGSELLMIDGVAVDSMYRALSRRAAGSTPQWRDYWCDRELLRGPAETEIELEYREPGGALKNVTVMRPPEEEDIFHDKHFDAELYTFLGGVTHSHLERLDDGWGYIKYTSFAHGGYENTIEIFDTYVDSLIDTPGLIIDLRGNGGGYVGAVEVMAGRFLEHKELLGYYTVRNPGEANTMEVFDLNAGGYTSKPPIRAAPHGKTYAGPVVILVDQRCFSACEMFTGGLQAVGRALVIGPEKTGGGSGFVGGLELPSGAVISFSWSVAWLPDGRYIEGNGVTPDIFVHERPRDWASGRDRVLERAIKALEQGEAKPPSVAETES